MFKITQLKFANVSGSLSAAFQGGRTQIHETLARFTRKCQQLDLPFAVAGGLAVNANGDRDRITRGVDVIMSKKHLEEFKNQFAGRGYMLAFPGPPYGIKDTSTNVPIDVLLAGGVPGSGKPEDTPVRFPFPENEDLLDFGGSPHLKLSRLLELKLASGITSPIDRMKDLVDVQVLIKCNDLPVEFEENLDPSVRAKFRELWESVQRQKKQ